MQMSHSETASDLLPAQFMKKQHTLCNIQYFCLSYLIKAESLQLFLVLFQIYFVWKLSHFPTCADPAVLYYLGLFASICECFTAQQRNRQLNGILNTEYFRKYLPPFTLLSCRFILMDKENLWMLFSFWFVHYCSSVCCLPVDMFLFYPVFACTFLRGQVVILDVWALNTVTVYCSKMQWQITKRYKPSKGDFYTSNCYLAKILKKCILGDFVLINLK